MRVMVIIKANKDSEAGVLPDEKLLTEMGKFNEELVNAGVMQAGDGLHPSSKGKRVRFSGSACREIQTTMIEKSAFSDCGRIGVSFRSICE
ncbi:MAG: hypothetical protein ND895_12560 [Pyrinomonadaceae bacterium]|nr:hypothetical protein [Pyrinomonadaceae bacterium]